MKAEIEGLTQILETLIARNETLAIAESITGGGLAEAFTSLPGSSAVFRGSVTAYQNDLKIKLLSVPAEVIAEHGVVSDEVAVAMATGAKKVLNSTWAISTTGVAGPGPVDGVAAGTVWLAIAGPISQSIQLELSGTREIVRNATIAGAIAAFARILKTL